MALLSENDILNKLKNLPGWRLSDSHIEKEFKLKDFVSALDFVTRVGKDAESMNHHPDILIFSYNKVKFTISTHNENGVTEKDFYLAKKIEEQAK